MSLLDPLLVVVLDVVVGVEGPEDDDVSDQVLVYVLHRRYILQCDAIRWEQNLYFLRGFNF